MQPESRSEYQEKLFQTVVAPLVLYGCAGWTLADVLKGNLRTAQRRMLRMMLASRRSLNTIPYVDWIQVETSRVEDFMKCGGIRLWVEAEEHRQHVFATKMYLAPDRWNNRLLQWVPYGKRSIRLLGNVLVYVVSRRGHLPGSTSRFA